MASWRTGFCGDGGAECCYAFCCPACAQSQVVGQLPPDSQVCCAGSCIGAFALNFIPSCGSIVFLYTIVTARTDVRKRAGIAGDPCSDLLTVVCCPCCSAAQELAQQSAPARAGAPYRAPRMQRMAL